MGSLTRTYSCKRPALVTPVFLNSRGGRLQTKLINNLLFTLGSVEPSKQLKQVFQIEHNIVKNPNWPEVSQLAIYNRGREFDGWIASPTR